VIQSKHWLLLVATGFSGCVPGESSSTGVGNPSVISMSIVADDEPGPSCGASGGALGEGGAAGASSDAAGMAETAGASAGAPTEAAGGDAGAAGAKAETAGAGPEIFVDDDDDLPRHSVTHAVIVIGELRWLPCDTTRDPSIAHGPFIVNLIGNLISEPTLPVIPDVIEPPGGFCGLEAPLTPASAPAELAGRSLFFDGNRSDGTPFVLYANVSATLRVRRHGSVVWDASATPAVLWAFRPRRWLSRMAIDQTTPLPWDDGSSTVVIDVNRHPMLLAALRRRLAGKSSLFLDVNKNRNLDPEDREVLVGDGSDDPD
jgi:hypothetical protein